MQVIKNLYGAKMLWGASDYPSGSECIGIIDRGNGDKGALIRLPNGSYVQGNAGSIRTLPYKVEIERLIQG